MTESGVHLFLHPKYRHQVVYTKLNLQICYLLQYYGEVLHV